MSVRNVCDVASLSSFEEQGPASCGSTLLTLPKLQLSTTHDGSSVQETCILTPLAADSKRGAFAFDGGFPSLAGLPAVDPSELWATAWASSY